MPPGAFVDKVRVDAAMLLLEKTDMFQRQVAVRCGFSSADVMRLAFMRVIGKSPRAYRTDFIMGADFEVVTRKKRGRR